MKYFTTL